MPTGVYKRTPEMYIGRGALISKAKLGHKHNEETKQKISKTLTGRYMPNDGQFKKGDNSNDKHHYWKGEAVSYSAMHKWVNRHLGKPDKCEHCGKDGLTGKNIHWANKSHEYKRQLDDWLRLCVPCHKKYDTI